MMKAGHAVVPDLITTNL